jgi:hypothetical protein
MDFGEEIFWCAVPTLFGAETFYAGTSRREMGEERARLCAEHGIPSWDVWVTVADTREEAEAYLSSYLRANPVVSGS